MSDSASAQALADEQGPDVGLHVEFYNVAGNRRATVSFHVEQDAYVLVGHIDSDGVLRISFPGDPTDDGFVKGQRSYRTPEFFAGFVAQYRQRYYESFGLRNVAANNDSYDRGLGYAFVIASWRPMHFERFSTSGQWDSFELADANFINDPRPAVYELASMLAGTNREAYTVKFASFMGTEELYAGSSMSRLGFDSFDSGYCSGYAPWGFASSPFDSYGITAAGGYWGDDFSYRGRQYYYDVGGDCYRPAPAFGYWTYNGYRPGTPVGTHPDTGGVVTRPFDPRNPHRHPTPPVQGLPGYKLPVPGDNGGSTNPPKSSKITPPTFVHTSPQYRNRGLITTDDNPNPRGEPVTRAPRIGAHPSPIDEHDRPTIQQMVNSHQSTNNGATDGGYGGWSRAQDRGRNTGSQNSDPGTHATPRAWGGGSNGGGEYHPREHPISVDNGGRPSEPRASSPSYTPRSAPPASPPPAPRVSSPPPAASSSSSGGGGGGGGAPVKPPTE